MARVFNVVLFSLYLMSAATGYALSAPHDLMIGEGFENPLGYHDSTPVFSWKLPVGTKAQSACQIQVVDAQNQTVLWDSQWAKSDQSVFVSYKGESLTSRQQIEWKVRFKDELGQTSEWSAIQTCELGLLSKKDWKAEWMRSASPFDAEVETVSWFRSEFQTKKPIKSARLYASAKGAYEIFMNGGKIGKEHFAPGWTSYQDRIDTMTYDVTEQIKTGGNAIGATLGTAWYAGEIWWHHDKSVKGQQPELLVQLEVIYDDGSVERIVSNNSWKETTNGPILYSGIYDGEEYDARRAMIGWSEVGFDDSDWKKALATVELGDARLTPKSLPPVVVKEELKAIKITEPTPGHFVYDFGQNFVGKIVLHNIPVEPGQTLQARVAEMLNQDGTLYTANYRSAKCVIKYTAADTKPFTWTQTYSFYGCRYVELTGLPEGAKPSIDWLKGLVLFSDMKPTGTFTSSHEKLNQLQSNIVWGQRGNFLEVPTDCPQRNERMGWTGDAQVFASTAMFNYDGLAFFKSWMESMRADQMDDGRIPHVIPAIYPHGGSAGWMDAATIIPWDVYVRTGDLEILRDNIEMMEKLVAYYESKIEEGSKLPAKLTNFGDWLQPYAKDRKGETRHDLISAAFYAHSLTLLAKSCAVTGLQEKARKYAADANAVKAAFTDYFLDEDGNLKNAKETQTSYVLALEFGLIPEDLRKNAEKRLKRLIDEADGHLRTGFLGTPYLTWVLDRAGDTELAFDLLFKETYPSWFYPINQGATTMWERWNSYSHKDGFGDAKMNSFNHYAYGAVGLWMYERIAGLSPDPENPGYKHFYVRPLIGGPLSFAKAELETPYGRAVSEWVLNDTSVEMRVVVPPNTTATVIFPNDRAPEKVRAGEHVFKVELAEPLSDAMQACWEGTNAVTTLSCDFTKQENRRNELYAFWNIHNRLDPYKHLGAPAGREAAKINCIRMLGGWKTKDASVDAYQWDGTNYVYRFDLVKQRIDFVRDTGMPIFQIVLDNVPWAFQRGIEFTDESDGEHYLAENQFAQYGNAIPPNDPEAWTLFIQSLMNELVDTYGESEVEQWRFRVGTEFDTYPGHWAGTKEELFDHYKLTTDAVRSVLPNAKVGIHIREAGFVKKNTVDYLGTQIQSVGTGFVEFCKTNKAHYDFLGITFYPMPNQKNRANVDTIYEKDIAPIKDHPDWNPDAIFEIHEYMMLTSTANHIFTGFGTSHGAAYFALVAQMMYTYDIQQVFQWGNVVAGLYKPEVLTTQTLETMVGKTRYECQKSGAPAVKGNRIDGIFAAQDTNKGYDAFIYNYHMKPAYREEEKINIALTVPHKAGTTFRLRYAYYDKDQNSFQRFVADFQKAGKSIDEGGWVRNGSNKNGEPQLILEKEGMQVYRDEAANYVQYNEVQWSDWQLGETTAGAAKKESVIQLGTTLPSFAFKKFEIEIID